jgi:hypothetical protein
MSDLHVAFVSKSFLRPHWDLDYSAWHDSENEYALDDRLALWAKHRDLNETSAESAFIDVFFRETWGSVQTGQRGSEVDINDNTLISLHTNSKNGLSNGGPRHEDRRYWRQRPHRIKDSREAA